MKEIQHKHETKSNKSQNPRIENQKQKTQTDESKQRTANPGDSSKAAGAMKQGTATTGTAIAPARSCWNDRLSQPAETAGATETSSEAGVGSPEGFRSGSGIGSDGGGGSGGSGEGEGGLTGSGWGGFGAPVAG